MSGNAVREYLTTQGLNLPADEVEMAVLAVQTILQMAQAEIDTSVIWYEENNFNLATKLGVNIQDIYSSQDQDIFKSENNIVHTLRQLYLAIDSWCSRHQDLCVSLFLFENTTTSKCLVRLISHGLTLPAYLSCDQQHQQQYLFVRSATTGWLSQIDDIDEWLKDGSLNGIQIGASQLSVPITDIQGQVLGVLYVSHTHKNAFAKSELIDWIAMAVAIVPFMINIQAAMLAEQTKGNNNDKDTIH